MPSKDREKRLAYGKAYMQKARDRANKIVTEAKDVPCADCGGSWPKIVMEFHHLEKKDFTISEYVKRIGGGEESFRKLLDEIGKCVVLCANCHRLRHWHAVLEGGTPRLS